MLVKKSLYFCLFFLLAFSFSGCSTNNSNLKFIAFLHDDGIKGYSSQWFDLSDGLPRDLIPEHITEDFQGNVYLTSEFSGIFRLSKGETKWENISSPIFKRRTQLPDVHEFRDISALCIDPENQSRIVIATKHTLYESKDRGKSWQRINVVDNKNSYYFTSLALEKDTIYAGTSFNGILKITSKATEEINNGIPKEFYVGPFHFCEEVSALAIIDNTLYAGFLFGKGLYKSEDRKNWQKIDIPFSDTARASISAIYKSKNSILITTSEGVFEFNPSSGRVEKFPLKKELQEMLRDDRVNIIFSKAEGENPALFIKKNTWKYSAEKTSPAGNKRALYVSWGMIDKDFEGFLSIVERTGFNAVVIDSKDDQGMINFKVDSKIASEIKAIKERDITSIIERLHKKGIYIIARHVTFKDKRLYEAYGNKYAIWDKVTNKPWVGLPRERWCDPFSQFVRDYNIEIAKATAKLGFDEIQFDYIRTPTDGLVGRCLYRYKTESDTFKSEILGDFIQQAARECKIPISLDIYGFNAWYKFGNIMGQDIKFLSRFASAIYPMVYPSHFGASFYKRYSEEDRPYYIVRDSAIRAIYHSKGRTVIRLWIQGWDYLSPTWGPDYILKQIKGVHDGGGISYSFWSPSGDHSMVDRALSNR